MPSGLHPTAWNRDLMTFNQHQARPPVFTLSDVGRRFDTPSGSKCKDENRNPGVQAGPFFTPPDVRASLVGAAMVFTLAGTPQR